MEHNLQDSDSQEIVELLSTASEKWRSIGLQLGLPNSTLNKVGELSNSDPVDRLSAVINEWLKMNGKEPTPKTLAEALKSESVQERKLAERVENKYGKESEVDSVTDGQSSSGPGIPHSSTAKHTQSPSEKPGQAGITPKSKQDTREVEPPAEILYKTCRDHVFKCEECRERLLKTFADQQNNIKCKNAKDGCDWRGKSIEEQDAHTAVCPKERIQCPFDEEFRCKKGFRREELNVHLQYHIASLHTQIKTCQCQSRGACPITFTIPGFQSSLQNLDGNGDDKEYKFPFYTHQGGYLLRLCVSVKSRDGLDLYVESMTGSFDDRLPHSGKVTIGGWMRSSTDQPGLKCKIVRFDFWDVKITPPPPGQSPVKVGSVYYSMDCFYSQHSVVSDSEKFIVTLQ